MASVSVYNIEGKEVGMHNGYMLGLCSPDKVLYVSMCS